MCEKEYWIWLQAGLGAGNRAVARLLDAGLDAKQVYQMSDEEMTSAGLTKKDLCRLRRIKSADILQVVKRCQSSQMEILTPDMPEFPEKLLNLYAPPAALYVKGNVDNLRLPVNITVVGTRTCTKYGYQAAFHLSQGLAACGIGVVSGLARGIDSAAHKGALHADGITIGVAACGLDIDYPYENTAMKRDILKRGTLVSEYCPGTPPFGGNFPVRNRLLAGIGAGVLVAEAGHHSGAMITAHYALEQGKDVFAVPNNIFETSAVGANELIRQGAKAVSDVMDIIEEYISLYPQAIRIHQQVPQKEEIPSFSGVKEESVPKWEQALQEPVKTQNKATAQPPKTINPPVELEGVAMEIYRMLQTGETGAEELLAGIDKPSNEVLAALTELEISGIVRRTAGGRFSIL